MSDDLPIVLAERIRYLSDTIKDLQAIIRTQGAEIEDLKGERREIILKLNNIQKKLDSVEGTVNKDSGWRGFMLDFVKAVAQIAVLVGAGKWIF